MDSAQILGSHEKTYKRVYVYENFFLSENENMVCVSFLLDGQDKHQVHELKCVSCSKFFRKEAIFFISDLCGFQRYHSQIGVIIWRLNLTLMGT